MDEKSHFYLENPQRSKKAIFGIFVLSLLMVAIPIGTYLTSQKTDFLPSASETEEVTTPEVDSLNNQPMIGVRSNQKSVAVNSEISVDVILDSPSESVNTTLVTLQFPRDLVRVTNIATSAAALQISNTEQRSWLESSVDEDKGQVSLLVGMPQNQTNIVASPRSDILIAKVFFKPLKSGVATMNVVDPSGMWSNKSNQNLLKQKNNLSIIITGTAEDFSSLTQLTSSQIPETASLVTSPQGGEIVSFYQPKTITWQMNQEITQVKSISLFLNDQFFGTIASNLGLVNSFEWNPSQTLLSFYATDENIFQIRVTGVTKDGKEIDSFSTGPFGLTLGNIGKQTTISSALSSLNPLFSDPKKPLAVSQTISQFISQFGQSNPSQKKFDINNDGVVTKIDLWFVRQFLLSEGVIK